MKAIELLFVKDVEQLHVVLLNKCCNSKSVETDSSLDTY